MADFVTARNRDASPSIRGFVYQVDLTIEQWLTLAPNQVLELEKGEDIDVVTQGIQAGRTLKQVKARGSSLTLRSAAALEFLANAREHLTANPDHDLKFRFVTNAPIGVETKSPFKFGVAALDAWQNVRKLPGSPESPDNLKKLRQILEGCNRPSAFNEATWAQFRTWLKEASEDDLLRFVLRIDWSNGVLEGDPLSERICTLLVTQGHAKSPEEARIVYQRLFLHVFKVLCSQGLKQLTPKERDAQLALPSLNAADSALLSNISRLLEALGARVERVEEAVGNLSGLFGGLQSQVADLARREHIEATVAITSSELNLQPPHLPEKVAKRATLVYYLLGIHKTRSWLFVHGPYGCGKTQIARLIVDRVQLLAWVHMRDVPESGQGIRLSVAIKSLGPNLYQGPINQAYEAVCGSLPKGGAIVLDDLPKLAEGSDFLAKLETLATACRRNGLILITTSAFDLPSRVKDRLDGPLMKPFPAPPFEVDDAIEVLKAYGAPESVFTHKRPQFLNSVAKGNPSLLAALAKHLALNNWNITENTFISLLQGKFAAHSNEDTQNAVIAAVEDLSNRQLLYRLNVPHGTFDQDDLKAVCEVPPAIDMPLERLATLRGPWIQEEATGRFVPCPLVRQLGDSNLDGNVRKRVNLVLGLRVLKRKVLGQDDATSALIYFVKAEEFNRAAVIMIMALLAYLQATEDVPAPDFLSYWGTIPLPAQMSLGQRIQIRALQLHCGDRAGKEPTPLQVSELDELLGQATPAEGSEAFLAYIVGGPLRETFDPVVACRYLQRALELRGAVPGLKENLGLVKCESPIEALIWKLGINAKSVPELHAWAETILAFTPEQMEEALKIQNGPGMCLAVFEHFVMVQAKQPKANQDWEPIRSEFQLICDLAMRSNNEFVAACALAGQMQVLGLKQEEAGKAVALGREKQPKLSLSSQSRFVVHKALGDQLRILNQLPEAAVELKAAVDEEIAGFDVDRFDSLLVVSALLGQSDPQEGVKYAKKAVDLVSDTEAFGLHESVRAHGELSIAYWLAGDMQSAFVHAEAATERLLSDASPDDTSKGLALLALSTFGFMTSIARWNKPSTVLDSPGEEALPPSRRAFFTPTAKYVNKYDNGSPCKLASQMASFAEGVGDDAKAAQWGVRALTLARKTLPTLAGYIRRNLPQYLAVEDRYQEVVEWCMDGARDGYARYLEKQAGREPLDANLDPNKTLESASDAQMKELEVIALLHTTILLVFRLGRIVLETPETAEAFAKAASEAIRKRGDQAANKKAWRDIADLLDTFHERNRDSKALLSQAKDYWDSGEQARAITCYVWTSLQKDVIPKDALVAHLEILPRTSKFLSSPGAHRVLILPFLVGFWNKLFSEKSSWFPQRQEMRAALQELDKIAPVKQLGYIIRAVTTGLRITFGQNYQQWVDNLP